MPTNQIPIPTAGKLILNSVKDELFPATNKLKDILVRIQKIRVSYQLLSPTLISLEKEYAQASLEFFDTARKLQTPNILFKDLDDSPEHMVAYFQFQGMFQQNIDQGVGYVEIIDRTLDRKTQNIQTNRTILISIAAILVSILR